jgi:outer membrane protein assembly factor BamB
MFRIDTNSNWSITRLFAFTIAFCLAAITLPGADIDSQWRGPKRDGKYPGERLLKKWPDGGPRMLWDVDGLGAGHGTVAVTDKKVYVTGMSNGTGILHAFDLDGRKLWQIEYGKEWTGDYPGARCTPVVVGNLMYLESGRGKVVCLDSNTGDIQWAVDLLERFDAKNISWGMTESLLIDGDKVVCTPGGPQHNVVALNRFDGQLVWTSKGNGEPAAYCSPILVNHNGTRLIVTMTAESVIGVDADDGTFYWRTPQHQGNKIHANSPLYFDGKIVCASSSAQEYSGIVLLQLSEDGKSVSVVWRNQRYRNLMGGVIHRDGYLYGAHYRRKHWSSIDVSGGEFVHHNRELGGGVIVYSDGLFYCYSDDGELALVDATPSSFDILSSFEITKGTGQHWAHPVIKAGRLYLRHGDALMVYDIARK